MKNYCEIKFKSTSVGNHKAILKLCISENQADTIALQFKNVPFKKENKELTVKDR